MNIDIKTADGADIELGGTYYDEKDTRYRATGIRVPDHQALAKSKLYCIKEGSGPVLTNPGSLYLVSPDSLERLRDDLDRFVRNQNGTSSTPRSSPQIYGMKGLRQMVTDERRRKVAAELRELAANRHYVDEFIAADTVGFYRGEAVEGFDSDSLLEVADLIDRPTTTRHGRFKTEYGRETPCCEVCGYSIGDMRWNHCPKCWAAIVDD